MSLPLYELPAKDADTTMERLTEDAARKAAASLGFPYFIGLSDGISLAAVVRHPQNPLKSLSASTCRFEKAAGFTSVRPEISFSVSTTTPLQALRLTGLLFNPYRSNG